MNPLTLSALALATILGIKVCPHKTDAAKVSLKGWQPSILAFLEAAGLYKTLNKTTGLEQGKSYFWAHIAKSDFDAVAIPMPKVEEVPAPVAVPIKTIASA